jgi:N-acetylneuraminate synthase
MSQYKNEIYIGNKSIGADSPVYFIADIAANHDGDLERAKDLIYLAAEAGADAAKFQHFKAETIVSDEGFKNLGAQKSHQSSWDKSVFQVYKDASVSMDWTPALLETCKSAGISFFTSAYDFELVDEIDPYVPAYKVGSGDISWLEMISHIASKNKPYIVASGASSLEEVRLAIAAGLKYNNQVALLQCNTNYTAELENFKFINLNVLNLYKKEFPGLILGLSDHTPGNATVLGAIALGAKIIEKHFTDNIYRQGPDHKFSMDPKAWREMVDRGRELENALGDGIKRVEKNESETVVLQRRALRLRHDLKAGQVLNKEDLIALRPCPKDAVVPYDLDVVLRKSLKVDLKKGAHIRLSDLNE